MQQIVLLNFSPLLRYSLSRERNPPRVDGYTSDTDAIADYTACPSNLQKYPMERGLMFNNHQLSLVDGRVDASKASLLPVLRRGEKISGGRILLCLEGIQSISREYTPEGRQWCRARWGWVFFRSVNSAAMCAP